MSPLEATSAASASSASLASSIGHGSIHFHTLLYYLREDEHPSQFFIMCNAFDFLCPRNSIPVNLAPLSAEVLVYLTLWIQKCLSVASQAANHVGIVARETF